MRIFTLVLVLCFSVTCGDNRPVLRVGTSGDYAPFSLHGQGFDIELAEQMAADFGMRVEWVPFQWPDLSRAVAANEFDVAMSGVTWQPARAVIGWMTRAVAAGGPCIIGQQVRPSRVGVNQGGFLERWTRSHFEDRTQVVTTDRNETLPDLLRHGDVEAIVTDSFELPHFRVDGRPEWCSLPVYRKVYWVAPSQAATLGPRIDAWLGTHEAELAVARKRWFGDPQPREPVDHVLDLFGRRLSFMPAVSAYKREHGIEIEDIARERKVLAAVKQRAAEVKLDPDRMATLFAAMITQSKLLQQRVRPGGVELDLVTEIRPALLALSPRIIDALLEAAPIDPSEVSEARLALLPVIDPDARPLLWRHLVEATAELSD